MSVAFMLSADARHRLQRSQAATRAADLGAELDAAYDADFHNAAVDRARHARREYLFLIAHVRRTATAREVAAALAEPVDAVDELLDELVADQEHQIAGAHMLAELLEDQLRSLRRDEPSA